MEHSYSRDRRPTDKTMATRTILVHKPPPCPSCHSSTQENEIDMEEASVPLMPLPEIDERAAKEAMDHIGSIAARTKNRNSEDDDWEECVDKTGWTMYQHTIFAKVAEILSLDRLARLTQCNHPSEPILRRANIDKAVARMRKAFAMVHWDTKLTQWLHGLLVDHLPVSFMAAYVDILQTLRSKVPTLVDKMTQGRSNELIEAVTKPPWDPIVETKDRKLTSEPIILIVPSTLSGVKDLRERNWISQFATMSPNVRTVPMPENFLVENTHVAECVEGMVTLMRTKLHEIRKEGSPQRPIILVGINAGAALALQVASLENNLNCVICIGFATNTMRGARGHLDDRLVDLQTPVLFVSGQNGTRSSQEQIESLREQMIAPTALVVVGSADDCLQVSHAKRKLEQITQAMVDSMVMDEIAEFTANCISNPPTATRRRVPIPATIVILDSPDGKVPVLNGSSAARKLKPDAGGVGATGNAGRAVQAGRVTKKKLQELASKRTGVAKKLSPIKKEYAEKISLTGGTATTTSFEIVTGKMKPEVRQMVDGSYIQIARGSSATMMLPVIQKQKISLGSHFTPMRTTGEQHVFVNTKQSLPGTTFLPKDVYSVNANGKKIYSLKTSADVMETIELDTDEEILNIDGDTILDAQVVDASTLQMASDTEIELSTSDISSIPVVFQDSDGNIQEPMGGVETEVGDSILISTVPSPVTTLQQVANVQSGGMPRPNKYIYYKAPSNIITRGPVVMPQQQQQPQYVVLSNVEEPRIVGAVSSTSSTTATTTIPSGTGLVNSCRPFIISVESLDKSEQSTLYHVISDAEEKEEGQ